jgi:hypothetical protein
MSRVNWPVAQSAPDRLCRYAAIALLVAALSLLLPSPLQAQAALEPRISALTPIDRDFMATQRDSIDALGRRHFGQGVSGSKDRDLELLQRLLDGRLVRQDQTLELQAMGIVLGDLLAAEYGLSWVVYEDSVGRTRALRYRDSDVFLFPVTMISRRYEVESRRPVTEIYEAAEAELLPALPPRPFAAPPPR